VSLIAAKHQHVAFVQQVVFTVSDELNLAAFTSQVLARARCMRYADHAAARR
jgi:hypothetical protein